jgi:hypothetical protein
MRAQLYSFGLVVGNVSNCNFSPVGFALHAPSAAVFRTSHLDALRGSRKCDQMQYLTSLEASLNGDLDANGVAVGLLVS